MKILQIAHCFLPESMTGAEIYAYNLSKELSNRHEVAVFYRINNSSQKEYKVTKHCYNALTVYKINNTLKDYNSLEKIYKNKDIEKAFLNVLDDINPDVVHIHHLLFLSLGIMDEIKKRNIPVIFTIHDYWLICPRGQLIKPNLELCSSSLRSNCLYCLVSGINLKNLFKRLFRLHNRQSFLKRFNVELEDIYKKVNLFIAPSNYMRNRFIEFGMPAEKIIYSDNGMDTGLFKDIEKSESDTIRFTFIGTLIPSKGAHILIKAFNRVKNNNKAVLKMYGKSPVNNGIFDYYHRIKRTARHNKNIKFMGTYDNKDIAEIFKKTDILVLPSLWQENAPLVLKEAILTKTPVIASDIGGVSEIIQHAKNGILFEPGNEKQLFGFIKDIIENPCCIEDFKRHPAYIKNIEENAKELESIYERIKS